MSGGQVTGGPWTVRDKHEVCVDIGTHTVRVAVAAQPEDAQRIAACVNACRDIPNEALDLSCEVGGMAAQMLRRIDAEAQRDELAAALREIAMGAEAGIFAKENLQEFIGIARAALAKVQA